MEETHQFCPWDGKRYIGNTCSHCGKQRYIKKPQWRKILYEKQPFEDTYVSESFLNSLVPKENSKKYEYSTLVESTVEIAYAFNSLILYLLVHEVAHTELVSEHTLLCLTFSVLIAGYVLYILLISPEMRSTKPVRVGFLLLGMLYTLCPVLATINKNYADDTIYMMTFIFCVLHLVFYDYSFAKNIFVKDKRKIPDAKSLNFSLIAMVLLSSRLNSMEFVYCLHCVGFMIFGFSLYLRSAIYHYSKRAYSILGILLCLTNTLVVLRFSSLLSGLVLSIYFFIRYLAPLWLLSVYSYKNEIKGPWDLPEIKLRYN